MAPSTPPPRKSLTPFSCYLTPLTPQASSGEEEKIVFSCFNQDQKLDEMDWRHLAERLRQDTVQEKLANLWLDHLFSIENPRLI